MKIRLSEPLSSGAPCVAPVLVRTLRALPKDPAGSHVLSVLGVAMRIAIEVGSAVGSPPDGTEVHLHALDAPGAFPVFHGTLRVEPADACSSRLVLAGVYQVPLGTVGAAADRTILAGAAKRSLRALLNDVRAVVAASVMAGVGSA